eukprot:gene4003-4253_t
MQDLAGLVPAVVDGGSCCCGVESTVLDGLRQPPVVLRPGGVTAEQLLQFVPEMSGLQVYSRDFKDEALEAHPTTPGMNWSCPEVVAQQLFAGLRAADAAGAALIIVQGLPPVDAGLAVMNRLHKAASKTINI